MRLVAFVVIAAAGCLKTPEIALEETVIVDALETDGTTLFWSTGDEILSFTPGNVAPEVVAAAGEPVRDLRVAGEAFFYTTRDAGLNGALKVIAQTGESAELAPPQRFNLVTDGAAAIDVAFGLTTFLPGAEPEFRGINSPDGSFLITSGLARADLDGDRILALSGDEDLALLPRGGGAAEIIDVTSYEFVLEGDVVFALIEDRELVRIEADRSITPLATLEADRQFLLRDTESYLYWWEEKSFGGPCYVFCDDLPFEDETPAAFWLVRSHKERGGREVLIELDTTHLVDRFAIVGQQAFFQDGGTLMSVPLDE